MAWEWIVLLAMTLCGPLMFHRFVPTRQETTVRGGAVFTFEFGLGAQVARTTIKFALVWIVALALAQLENRLWLRIWVIAPALLGLSTHFFFVKRHRVHWLSGRPLDPHNGS